MAVKTQQLRSTTASKRPLASALLDGELAVNVDAGTPGLFFENDLGAVVKIGPCEVGGTAPNAAPAAGGAAGNSAGEFWFDTANSASGNGIPLLKIFNGSTFVHPGAITLGTTPISLGNTATLSIAGLTDVSTGILSLFDEGSTRYFEASANGSNFVAFKAPTSVAADLTFTLPGADGTAGQVIVTDGNGVLSFGSDADNASITDGDTSVTVNGTTDTITFATAGSDIYVMNADGDLIPSTTSAQDLGSTSNRFQAAFIDALTVTGNITGTWDGDIISPAKGGSGLDGSTAPNGSLLIGNGSGYTLSTLTAGTGLTITNAGGSITPSITDTAVTAAAYGSATSIPTFTVNAQGQLTAAANLLISIPHTQVNDFDAGVQTNRLDQMAAPTASVSFNNQKITDLATPTGDLDAANKGYVDSVAEGLDSKQSCYVATAAALPAVTYNNGTAGVGATLTANGVGALTVDGEAIATTGLRILVKDQVAQLQNGIYVVTTVGDGSNAFVLTRSEDCDTAEQILHAFTFIENGNTTADNGYTCTATEPITMGTTALPWTQFSGAGQITAGTGMTKTGNTLDVIGTADRISVGADNVDIASTYVGQSSITTLGTIASGVWNANIIGLAYGGTGVDNSTGLTASNAFMAPNGANGAASFREILTTDIAPVTGGSFDAGTY